MAQQATAGSSSLFGAGFSGAAGGGGAGAPPQPAPTAAEVAAVPVEVMRSFLARSPDVWRLLKAHEQQQAARRASAQVEAGVVAHTIGVATSTRVGDIHKITAAQTATFEGLRLPALWNLSASERPGEARNGGPECTYILGDPRGDLSLAAPAPLRRTIDMVQLEASRVVDMLAASLGRAAAVHYVVRIQNLPLWDRFLASYRVVAARIGRAPEVRALWHGTAHPEPLRTIAHTHQGFDPRVVTKNGKAFGHGVYFHRDACYADGYAPPDPHCAHLKHLLLSLVVVGEPCIGRASMRRPDPSAFGASHICDTAVDSIDDPSLFVVFESGGSLAYPLYTVAYK